MSRENATNTITLGETGKFVLIHFFPINSHRTGKAWEIGAHTFSTVWVLFIGFPSWIYFIIWKCMCFLIDFPYYEKDSKTSRMEKAWGIGSHTFSIVWVLFTIRFPSCGILYHMGNALVSPSISHSTGKPTKSYRMRENLGNWYSYM